MISAIITENFFELLYNKLQIGAMGTFEQITQFTIDFEKKYREIKDWEEKVINKIVMIGRIAYKNMY